MRVLGIQGDVQSNSDFTILTLFEDLIYVWLVGPELVAAQIQPAAYFNAYFNGGLATDSTFLFVCGYEETINSMCVLIK